jgi:hypothetical protein
VRSIASRVDARAAAVDEARAASVFALTEIAHLTGAGLSARAAVEWIALQIDARRAAAHAASTAAGRLRGGAVAGGGGVAVGARRAAAVVAGKVEGVATATDPDDAQARGDRDEERPRARDVPS